MEKKGISNITILLIVGGIVVFAVGVGLGVLYQSQKDAKSPVMQKAIKIQPTINALTSRTIQSIVVFGQVQKINGRSLTINYAGDQIVTNIGTGAQIFSLSSTKDPKTGNLISGAPKLVSFINIKPGQNVTVTLKMLDSGLLEGESVYIFYNPS
jgi:hypothetical protein